MILTIDTSQPLTLTDRGVLAMLLNGVTAADPAEPVGEAGNGSTDAPREEPASPTPKASKPRAAKPKIAKDDTTEVDPMQLAVQRASQLVSDGQADVVRAALKAVGARRVGELPEGDVAAFLAALDAA